MPPAQAVPVEKPEEERDGINAILLGAPGSGKGTQVSKKNILKDPELTSHWYLLYNRKAA